jgi:hypothetical protein
VAEVSDPKHTPTVLSGPCPGCNGEPYGEHWDAPYVCPDCAGTGKAENSITANEKLRDAAPRLAEALKQCIFKLTVSEEAFRQGGNQNWSGSIAETLKVARAALREAGVES